MNRTGFSRQYTAASAAALLMAATLVSRVVGYLRDAYVAYAFGAGPLTDAYIAAFTLPDFLLYLFAGGSISITFVSLLTRYQAEGREREASEAFSAIVTVMAAGFAGALLLGEIFADRFVALWFPGFGTEQAALCTTLTRILLPQPLFLMVGGVVSAVQQTHRQFLLPALAPIVYTAAIIAGGVTLADRIGISSLAVGATVGAIVGPFALNALGAARTGIRYRFLPAPNHPAFREWLRMSLPLMLGVSVVAADDWILRVFASSDQGAITLLNYAKRLLQVPIGVLGQAVAMASLPFFARLASEGRREEFARTVNESVARLAALCLLASSWMMATAPAATDLAFRRGRFDAADTATTAWYLLLFAPSLAFWSVQGLYARAFYATGDMLRPMVAATLVTLASVPAYWLLYASAGPGGLVAASNLAIVLHTLVLAVLLDRRGMVKLPALAWGELGRAAAAAAVAGLAGAAAGGLVPFANTRASSLANLAAASAAWAAAALAMLVALGSELPGLLAARLRRRSAVTDR